jgi:hypothetical protein
VLKKHIVQAWLSSSAFDSEDIVRSNVSVNLVAMSASVGSLCADSFQSFQGSQHFFPKVFTTGWLLEAAMSKVTERTHNFLNLCQRPGILVFYFGDLRLEALAGLVDTGVDGCERMGFPAAMVGELEDGQRWVRTWTAED